MPQLIKFAQEFGVPLLLVCFFIYWSYLRERRLSDKLDEVQKERIQELLDVVKSNTQAFMALKITLDRWNARPCLAEDRGDHR